MPEIWYSTANWTSSTSTTTVWIDYRRMWNSATISCDTGHWYWTNVEEPSQERLLRDRLERRRVDRVVEARARSLLRRILTDEEWLDYERHGSVRIVGRLGAYEVGGGSGFGEPGRGWQGMIYRLDAAGEPAEKLCCHPPLEYPLEDRIAAVVLALRTNEEGVLRKANRHAWKPHERERVRLRRAFRSIAA